MSKWKDVTALSSCRKLNSGPILFMKQKLLKSCLGSWHLVRYFPQIKMLLDVRSFEQLLAKTPEGPKLL